MTVAEKICNGIETHSQELIDLAQKIWEDPEIGFAEYQAAAWTAEVLRENGFDVEAGAYGMPTAIRAAWGHGGPVVGFCGEYDCLAGLSQKAVPWESPVVPGGPGHGCGHNLLGVGCVGACIALKEHLAEANESGTVVFYGCPGEEQVIGKGLMAKAGAFKECDFTVTWHPANENRDTLGKHTGNMGAYFDFDGTTAHAGAAPHLGRSALDAVQLMNMGVEFLREHVTNDVRIHYIIRDGGHAVNIVPKHARVQYLVRALDYGTVQDTFRRIQKCAEGAAIMTETEMHMISLGGMYPTMQNHVIGPPCRRPGRRSRRKPIPRRN